MRRFAALVSLVLALGASMSAVAHGRACGNERLRASRGSEGLPDCRAYEQVTPLGKSGGDATGTVPYVKAALDGGMLTFLSNASSGALREYTPSIAIRTASGWSSDVLLPSLGGGRSAEVIGLTPDLSEAFVRVDGPGERPPAALLARSAADGALSTLVPFTAKLEPRFVGASEDGSLVLFESAAALPGSGPAIAGGPNLYAWDRDGGAIRLIAVFNDGRAPPEGAFGGSYDWVLGTTERTLGEGGAGRDYYTQDQHVVSAAGSAAYFTAAGTGELYLRRNPGSPQSPLEAGGGCASLALACTVDVSASRKTAGAQPGAPGAAAFMGASADGASAFFTSTAELTDDANTGPEPLPPAIARAAIDGSPASIEPSLLPISATGVAVDGSHLYWADPSRGSIGRAGIDGSGVEENFVSGLTRPRWVTVDGEYVYWTSPSGAENSGGGTIGRARLDGDGASEPNFISGAGKPRGVAVNDTHVFWADDATHSIARAKIDGSGVELNFHPLGRAEFPQGVAVNDTHIYWTENEPAGYVSRSNLDGSHETFRFIGTSEELRGLAIDGRYVYWAAQGGGAIGRANLELAEAEFRFIAGVGRATGLAVDGQHLYWAKVRSTSPGSDLYRYDAGSDELVDLTPNPEESNGTEVKGVLGISADGSYVYFVANGVLANAPNGRGETALPGTCNGNLGSVGGSCNLYVFHAGTVAFVARLEVEGGAAESDAANWAATPTGVVSDPDFQQTARVSSDGRTLLFRSRRPLTGYASEGVPELYRYSAGDGDLICVSCDPGGAAPTGAPTLSSILPSTRYGSRPAGVLTHNLSANGDRVFFESVDALVEADRNGEEGCPRVGFPAQRSLACRDVYEWEAPGSGSCRVASVNGGCLYLLSGALGGQPASFGDASEDGDDAFIFTTASLVGQDRDELLDVYDARVNGGLPAQDEPPTGCAGEACRPPRSPVPALASPATVGLGPRRRSRRCRRVGRHRHGGDRRCGKPRKTHR